MLETFAPPGVLFALLLVCLNVGGALGQECECPPEVIQTNILSATFTSPKYPSSYCPNITCNYEIVPRKNWAVALEVDHLDIDEQEDFLEISQTANDQNGQRHRVSGMRLSGKTPSVRIFYSSIGGGFHVSFHSNAEVNDFLGFRISFRRFRKAINMTRADVRNLLHYEYLSGADSYSAIRSLNDAYDSILVNHKTAAEWYTQFQLGKNTVDDSTLNEIVDYPLGNRHENACPPPLQVSDDNWRSLPTVTAVFPTKTSCAFQINSTSNGVNIDVIKLTYGTTLEIRDENLLKIFDSPQRQPVAFSSRTSSVTVFLTVTQGASYDVQFKNGASICACPTKLIQLNTGESHVLTSPAFPFEYCNMADCKTDVLILPSIFSEGTRPVVRVIFDTFHVENNYDYLEMIGANALIQLTDVANSIRYFTFDQPEVTLRFVADSVDVRAGFNLTVDYYEKPQNCTCPGSPVVIRESMQGSDEYSFAEDCEYMDCFWTIHSFYGRSVNLNIDYRTFAPTEFIEVSKKGPNFGVDRTLDRIRMESNVNGLMRREIDFQNIDFVTVWYHREGDNGGGERTIKIDYSWN